MRAVRQSTHTPIPSPVTTFREHPFETPTPKSYRVWHARLNVTLMSLAGNSDWAEVMESVVSRNEESRSQFLHWARWKIAGGRVEQDPQAAEVDDLISGMPASAEANLSRGLLARGAASGPRGLS